MKIQIELDTDNPRDLAALVGLADGARSNAVTSRPPADLDVGGMHSDAEAAQVTVTTYSTPDKASEALAELNTVPGVDVEQEEVLPQAEAPAAPPFAEQPNDTLDAPDAKPPSLSKKSVKDLMLKAVKTAGADVAVKTFQKATGLNSPSEIKPEHYQAATDAFNDLIAEAAA